MLELMVPLPLPKKEQICAEQVAKELELQTELVITFCKTGWQQLSFVLCFAGAWKWFESVQKCCS